MWTARAILRILFACALAAIVIWGGGGRFAHLGDEEEQREEEAPGGSGSGDQNGALLPRCADGELSREAAGVVDTIADGGEFRYPGKDGSTFGNREGLLPGEDRGYYAEYTVPTPGESDRGTRRIVTGGDTTPHDGSSDPEHWYWTADHYESFCEFAA